MSRISYLLGSLLLLPVLVQFSCRAVGPDYKKPVIPPPPNWSGDLSEGLQAAAIDDDTLARWWTTLNDPTLESLMDRAVRGNLDLRRAAAVLRQARAERGVAVSERFPTVTASGLIGYNRISDRMGRSTNVGHFSSGFDAGWEADFFGGIRRSIEAADASVEASQESLRDTLVSLVAEVAINYVEVRQFQRQLSIAENNLGIQQDSLRLAEQRFGAGLTSRFDVDQARYIVADTRSRIPVLQTLLAQAKNRLAVLLGENPGVLANELRQPAPIPVGPAQLAVGIPADALRRRPDVRRAERILAAQTARVGVATAARYPQFGLPGSIGYDFITKGNPLSLGNLIGSLGASAFYTLFDAGRLRQQVEIQNALQEQAFLDYQTSILLSLEDVENALVAYADQQVRRRSLLEAAEAAERAVETVRANYVAGLVDFQPVLESQRSLLSFQDDLAQTDGAVTSELIRLYKALGGGWAPLPPQPAPGRP
ncbi:MAG: efflux transporter outer membrane subunit [Acidobacteria bacterium]|nr:MAG: efflux transporter outer membrane subunit [Acidobacteriota bacterium]